MGVSAELEGHPTEYPFTTSLSVCAGWWFVLAQSGGRGGGNCPKSSCALDQKCPLWPTAGGTTLEGCGDFRGQGLVGGSRPQGQVLGGNTWSLALCLSLSLTAMLRCWS